MRKIWNNAKTTHATFSSVLVLLHFLVAWLRLRDKFIGLTEHYRTVPDGKARLEFDTDDDEEDEDDEEDDDERRRCLRRRLRMMTEWRGNAISWWNIGESGRLNESCRLSTGRSFLSSLATSAFCSRVASAAAASSALTQESTWLSTSLFSITSGRNTSSKTTMSWILTPVARLTSLQRCKSGWCDWTLSLSAILSPTLPIRLSNSGSIRSLRTCGSGGAAWRVGVKQTLLLLLSWTSSPDGAAIDARLSDLTRLLSGHPRLVKASCFCKQTVVLSDSLFTFSEAFRTASFPLVIGDRRLFVNSTRALSTKFELFGEILPPSEIVGDREWPRPPFVVVAVVVDVVVLFLVLGQTSGDVSTDSGACGVAGSVRPNDRRKLPTRVPVVVEYVDLPITTGLW